MPAPSKRAPTLYGIVAFKVVRGAILLILAMRVYALVGENLRPHFDAAVSGLKLDPETEFFEKLGDRIDAITPGNVRWAASGLLLYGLLSLTEGVGLALRTRWAGLLVIAESGFFIPLETYQLIKHPTGTILAILIVNLAIVLYLHFNRKRLFKGF